MDGRRRLNDDHTPPAHRAVYIYVYVAAHLGRGPEPEAVLGALKGQREERSHGGLA